MALHDFVLIEGVTKVETAVGFRYKFPIEIIETNTVGGYFVRSAIGESGTELVYFSDIANKLGASNVEQYVDTLCNRKVYTLPKAANGGEISLFNEVEVAERFPLIERKSAYPVSNLRDNIEATGSATIAYDSGEYRLTTTANGSDSLTISTFEIARDISHTDSNTGIGVRFPNPPTGNQVAEWGLKNGTDGIVFGYDATGLYIRLIKNGATETKVYSTDWTDEDGIVSTLDMTKGMVFNIDFAHYGYGPFAFSVYTENAQLKYKKSIVHRMEVNGAVNLENPNLPLFVELDNGGTATAFDMYMGGRQYSIVGAYNPTFRQNGDLGQFSSIGTTPTLIASFRRKSSFDMVNVKFRSLRLAPSDVCYYYVVQGNTLTSPSWGGLSEQQTDETSLEIDTTATDVLDGIVVNQGFAVGNSRNSIITSDEVEIIVAKGLPISLFVASQSTTVGGTWSMNFKEEW